MKRLILGCLLLLVSTLAYSQSNNPLSIYEGEVIQSVRFRFENLPSDAAQAEDIRLRTEKAVRLYPQTQYNSVMASYYSSQVSILPFVEKASLDIVNAAENGIDITMVIVLNSDLSTAMRRQNVFRDASSFPVIYNSERSFLTLKAGASEMAYSNNNAWFAQPTVINAGNPLADSPSGEGYTAWVEGFATAGIYGVTRVVKRINLHVYAGASYLASFTAGNELFTNEARIYGDVEEAFAGVVGGWRSSRGDTYSYNVLYGRKQFILGDGWLIINTSMNGSNRAALQLNPRWASKNVFQATIARNRVSLEGFRLEANELPILSSGTVIQGLNLQLGNQDQMLIGLTMLHVPYSRFRYYMPNGDVHTREGMQLYNLRVFRNAPLNKGGLFFKAEIGYQRNKNFNMKAFAYYGEVGWSFTKSYGNPSFSYRYAAFPGDNPKSKSYNRWDALYTGGTGEQWVQGSNMYKMVQNSNEITHRLQAIFRPVRKVQLVAQAWVFYADQLNNTGGSPALTQLKSKFYGSEYNLTLKYFHSRHWYFHLNTAYTIPGSAIKDNVPGAKNWFCLMAFARYSF